MKEKTINEILKNCHVRIMNYGKGWVMEVITTSKQKNKIKQIIGIEPALVTDNESFCMVKNADVSFFYIERSSNTE